MTYVFVYGTFGSPTEAWFPWLKIELERLGHEVIIPQVPTDDWSEVSKLKIEEYQSRQNLTAWTDTFEKLLPNIQNNKELCFVGHSLGPMFILLMAEKYGLHAQNAYFVAPFFHPATEEELKDTSAALIHKANITFYYHDFDFVRLRSLISQSTVIYSDDDPNVHEWEALEFAEKLGSKTIKLTGLGHMSTDSHLLKFPQLLDAIKQDNP